MELTSLKGVGLRTAKKLENLGIHNVADILFHLPYRYEDRTRVVPIGTLHANARVVIEGKIIAVQVKFAGRRQLQLTLRDASGEIQLKFFHFNVAQKKNLTSGIRLRCFGEVKLWRRQLIMIHPEYQLISDHTQLIVEENLTPIYPTTDGLSQHTWRNLTEQALRCLQTENILDELLPLQICQRYALPELKTALAYVHRPPADVSQQMLEQNSHPMQQRLAFEELLAHQVSLRQLRAKIQQHQAYPLPANETLGKRFLASLSFSLTTAQQKVLDEIETDLTKMKPMLRLLQGDVGAGKTVVAALAALRAIANNCQVVLMAPTELLAEQHYKKFQQWFMSLGIKVTWLSGQLKTVQRRNALASIASGEAQLVVGTHALLQKKVVFHKVVFLIIDEQHRFGVLQRSTLREKSIQQGIYPHQLIMTATPIPRTLAMTVYANLDISVIDELPPGRTPIKTAVVNNQRRVEVINKVRQLCQQGGQVYWVCALIEESEILQCAAAEEIAQALELALRDLTIGLLHGRLKPEKKHAIMQEFNAGKIDVLVATTVIEVGIDVPNASLMVIDNPERMGLAQLHQLRGRVGRGTRQSHCILLYQEPLSVNARQRLMALRESNDGFYIAQQDLKLRGPGEVLGTKQTGVQRLRIADIIRDRYLLSNVQQAAREILQHYPEIVALLKQRWIGDREQLAKV